MDERKTMCRMIQQYKQSMPQDSSDALKCVGRIKCWVCLDTERMIHPRFVPTFLGYSPYAIVTCRKCRGREDHIRCADTKNETERGRPIPYYGESHPFTERELIRVLADIYRREYQAIDKEIEEKNPYREMSDDDVLKASNWQRIQSSLIDMHIREWELEVDVKSIVDNVSMLIQSYSGNVISLVDMVSNLKVKFRVSSEQSVVEERLTRVDVDEEGQPFFINITYHMTDDKDGLDVGIANYFRTTRHVRGEVKLMQPAQSSDGHGSAAQEICRRMMNREASRFIFPH